MPNTKVVAEINRKLYQTLLKKAIKFDKDVKLKTLLAPKLTQELALYFEKRGLEPASFQSTDIFHEAIRHLYRRIPRVPSSAQSFSPFFIPPLDADTLETERRSGRRHTSLSSDSSLQSFCRSSFIANFKCTDPDAIQPL